MITPLERQNIFLSVCFKKVKECSNETPNNLNICIYKCDLTSGKLHLAHDLLIPHCDAMFWFHHALTTSGLWPPITRFITGFDFWSSSSELLSSTSAPSFYCCMGLFLSRCRAPLPSFFQEDPWRSYLLPGFPFAESWTPWSYVPCSQGCSQHSHLHPVFLCLLVQGPAACVSLLAPPSPVSESYQVICHLCQKAPIYCPCCLDFPQSPRTTLHEEGKMNSFTSQPDYSSVWVQSQRSLAFLAVRRNGDDETEIHRVLLWWVCQSFPS